MHSHPHGHHHSADGEKRFVALSSVFAAVFLTGMKLVVGLSTGSLGILSEAAHSGLDLVAAVITLFAVRTSSKPADREHPYGHGKVESISALFETVLLLVTCVWIVYEAIHRLFFHQVDVEANVWGFLVILISIVVDSSRSRALSRAAKKYQSQALEADALHFSTDIWSSLVVLFGLGMVYLAHRFDQPWLVKADSVAALMVAGIVVWISVRLGRKTVADLLDTVPGDLVGKVIQAAQVPGVSEVLRARVRRSGPVFFADVTLSVPREYTLAYANEIAHQAEASIRKRLPEADVVVHVDPSGQTHESAVEKIRDIARRHGLDAHAIAFSTTPKLGSIEMHLEVDKSLSVEQAHEKVSLFETDLRNALPSFPSVTTHIEPFEGDTPDAGPPSPSEVENIRNILTQLVKEYHLVYSTQDLLVRREAGKLAVVLRCACDGRLNIAEAHEMTVKIEDRLRLELPHVGRIVIHIEPMDTAAQR
ncbi:MAG: cation-efflux pump [Pseudomonadota bacterium]